MFFRKRKLDETEFALKFINFLRKKVNGIDVVYKNGLEIATKYNGGEYRHFLDNAFSEYSRDPKDLKNIIQRYIESALSMYDETEQLFSIRQIVPIVKNKRFVESLKELNGTNFESRHVYEPYNGDLFIFYAADTEYNIEYLQQKHLQELGIVKDELRQIAIENLGNMLEIKKHDGDLMYMITAGGSYEASIILMNVWNKETFPVKGNIVVGIPTRDMLLITGSENSEGLHKLYDLIENANLNGDHLVSEKMFELVNGKFEILTLNN